MLRLEADRKGRAPAYRKQRDLALAGATHCHICGNPFTNQDLPVADHIRAYADNGPESGVAHLRSSN